jgi:hypothetical protein
MFCFHQEVLVKGFLGFFIVSSEKVLIFSSVKAVYGRAASPSIGARLINTSGMKLPAGPITVFDEKRLIFFGDDLSVQGSVTAETQERSPPPVLHQ